MKGISPLIAAVLLIAFTVAVGGIIATWLTSFSKTTTAGVESSTKGASKCSGVYIEVKGYDNTTAGGTDKIVLTNPSGETLTNLKVYTDGTDRTSLLGSTTLSASDVVSISGADLLNGVTTITATGLCQNNVVVSGKCESGDSSCWTSFS